MSEFRLLSAEHRKDVAVAVLKCLETGKMEEEDQAYAYPHPSGAISWGVNAGPNDFNIARGMLTRVDLLTALVAMYNAKAISPQDFAKRIMQLL